MKLNKHKSTVFLEIFSGVFCLIVSTWNNHRFLPGCPYRDRSMEMTEKSTTKKNLIKSKTLRSTPYLRHIQFSKSSQCLLFVCRSIGGESKNLCNIVKNLYCFMSIASVFFCYAHKGQTQVFKHPTTNRLHFVSFQMLRN